jgi:hypothetical protein
MNSRMSVSIVDAIEHMTPAQVLRTLGFEPHPIGPILEGVYYVGPPEIPGLSAKEIARWSVYWSWVMLHDLDAAPQRLLNTNGTRSGIKPAITTTFAEYCAARGVCRCLHGDSANVVVMAGLMPLRVPLVLSRR